MRKTGPRQLSFVFADSPSRDGKDERSDAFEPRSFLLQKAKRKKPIGPNAGAADTSRLLEAAASEANLARALLNVVRNKGKERLKEVRSRHCFPTSCSTNWIVNWRGGVSGSFATRMIATSSCAASAPGSAS